MQAWNPERELTALLDALSEELLAAPDGALAGLLHRAGAEGRAAACEMRRRLAVAECGLHRAPASPLAVQGARLGAKPQ